MPDHSPDEIIIWDWQNNYVRLGNGTRRIMTLAERCLQIYDAKTGEEFTHVFSYNTQTHYLVRCQLKDGEIIMSPGVNRVIATIDELREVRIVPEPARRPSMSDAKPETPSQEGYYFTLNTEEAYLVTSKQGPGAAKAMGERMVACYNFCKGVSSEDLSDGIGVFVQAYLDARQRIQLPRITEAITVLKEGGG